MPNKKEEGSLDIPKPDGFTHYNFSEVELKHLAGKILTLIDATQQDPEQRKALKDIIKTEFAKTFYNFQECAWSGKSGHSIHLDDYKDY